MATRQRNKSSSSRSRSKSSGSGRSNGRSASQKGDKYRFAQNVGEERTVAEREYLSYALSDPQETGDDPDVLLDVPVVKVDSIHLELDDLQAHIALKAQVLDLVKLNVGVAVQLGRVCVDVKGVEAQALLKVRLDHVAAIVDRVLTTIDRNPDLVKSLGKAVEDIGSGAGHTLGEAGEAVEDVGEGAQGAVKDVGKGAGQATGELGKGAGQAVGEVGEGAGQAVGDVGQGAGQAVGNLDQTVGGVGQAAGQVGEAAGQAAGGVAGGGQGGQGGQQQGGGGGLPDVGGGVLAKEAAKTVAKEIGSAATDEAKDLGVAATRKVKELGERRRQRRAEKHHATPAALKAAEELDVDLDEVEGSGAEGRITVRDVRGAG
ncbi:MAG: E3 binding domain-containing protein [Thermoleophilaceae bacterium]